MIRFNLAVAIIKEIKSMLKSLGQRCALVIDVWFVVLWFLTFEGQIGLSLTPGQKDYIKKHF